MTYDIHPRALTLANAIAHAAYKQSADPTAEENQSPQFQIGFQSGFTRTECIPDCVPLDAGYHDTTDRTTQFIEEVWEELGRPSSGPEWESFKEWKRGYWAGVWCGLGRRSQTALRGH